MMMMMMITCLLDPVRLSLSFSFLFRLLDAAAAFIISFQTAFVSAIRKR
jgi:hypothetical protein